MRTLSVVIVTYKAAGFIDDCLLSLASSGSDDLELDVIVVDNDSPDDTANVIERGYPWVTLVRAGGNLGFAVATNMGLRVRRGSDVLILNPDTVVAPGVLAAAVAELHERPEVGILGVKLVRADGTLDHAAKRSLPTVPQAIGYFSRLDRLGWWRSRWGTYTADELGADQSGPVGAVNGAFMLVRAEVLETCPTLDERFWMYGEDVDYCRQATDAGWTVYYWPERSILHLKGASTPGRRDPRLRRAFFDQLILYWEKYHPEARPVTKAALRVCVRLLETGSRIRGRR
jgi:N-acetylglucosaminyl-diphospho-decaprenol L-rhamnosyltransferase